MILGEKGWGSRAGVVEFAIQEIVDNAYRHGLRSEDRNGVVRIRAELSSLWANCQVTDSGQGFDLAEILKAQSNGEPRGLTQVERAAARLKQRGPNTIEVLIERHPGSSASRPIDGIHVLKLSGRFDHTNEHRYHEWLQFERSLPDGSKLIVDLTETEYVSSIALRTLMLLRKASDKKRGTVVLVSRPDGVVDEILKVSRFNHVFPIADTVQNAMEMLRTADVANTKQQLAQPGRPGPGESAE